MTGAIVRTAATLLAMAPSSMFAAGVSYILEYETGPKTYRVYADVDRWDNFGLAGYYLNLTNVLTVDNISPRISLVETPSWFGPVGFSQLRSADGSAELYGSQDFITPSKEIIYGFGQHAGSFSDEGLTPYGYPVQVEQPEWGSNFSWSAPSSSLLLASGTYASGSVPGFGEISDSAAFVFKDQSGTVEEAQVFLSVYPSPEPTCMTLVIVGGMGIGCMKRRTRYAPSEK